MTRVECCLADAEIPRLHPAAALRTPLARNDILPLAPCSCAPDSYNETVIQRTAAVAAAKATAAVSRRFRLGGGTALPGLVAERIDPDVIRDLAAELGQGSVIVTGTNGKTTTARMLRSIAKAGGLKPVANRAGSNMMRGIAAALVDAADWSGDIASPEQRLGIFEVDEATLPHVANAVRPRAVLFTNLFRDQLDRYGEVETVAAVWRSAVAEMPSETTIVLNADDPSVASLAGIAQRPRHHLRDDRRVAWAGIPSNTRPMRAGAPRAAVSWRTPRSCSATWGTGAVRSAATPGPIQRSPAGVWNRRPTRCGSR